MKSPRYRKIPCRHRRYPRSSLIPMRGSDISAKDHNETLAMLYAAIATFYTCGIIGAPWIIEKNFRRPEQIPTAILVFGAVSIIAVLFWLAAIFMYRRKSLGRTLALIAAPITIFAFWSVGICAWWFMHSHGGKALYGIDDDS
jgi:hypothetical protein